MSVECVVRVENFAYVNMSVPSFAYLNMVHACEMANETEKDIAIRRAFGFNELFEAALKKESEQNAELGSGVSPEDKSGSGKGKEKQQFGPEVEELKKLAKQLVKQSGGI